MKPKRAPFTPDQLAWFEATRDKVHELEEKMREQEVRMVSMMLLLRHQGLASDEALAVVCPQADRVIASAEAARAVDDMLGPEDDL
jgi:hypothetical protein